MSWWQIKLWILPKFIAGKELRILSNNFFYYFFSFDPDSNFQEGTDSWILNILMPENQNNFIFFRAGSPFVFLTCLIWQSSWHFSSEVVYIMSLSKNMFFNIYSSFSSWDQNAGKGDGKEQKRDNAQPWNAVKELKFLFTCKNSRWNTVQRRQTLWKCLQSWQQNQCFLHSVSKQAYYLVVVRIKRNKNSYFGIGWSLSVREFSLLWVLVQHSHPSSIPHLSARIPGFDLATPTTWLFTFASTPSYPTCQKLWSLLFKKTLKAAKYMPERLWVLLMSWQLCLWWHRAPEAVICHKKLIPNHQSEEEL